MEEETRANRFQCDMYTLETKPRVRIHVAKMPFLAACHKGLCQCFVSSHVAKEKLSEIILEKKKKKNLLFYPSNFRLRTRLYAPLSIHSRSRQSPTKEQHSLGIVKTVVSFSKFYLPYCRHHGWPLVWCSE